MLNKITKAALAAALACFAVSQASAQLTAVFTEDFSAYNDGDNADVFNDAGGVTWNINGGAPFWTVNDDGAFGTGNYVDIVPPTGFAFVNLDFSLQTAASLSFTASFAGSNAGYFRLAPVNTGGTNAGNKDVGSTSNTGTLWFETAPDTSVNMEFVVNTTGAAITAAGGQTVAAGTVALFINGNALPSQSSAVAAGTVGLDRFGIWASGQGGTAFSMRLDNLVVNMVPEPSTYAMLAGLAALGFVMVRRRK